MYAASIRRLLELYPAGASQEQLLWRLKVAGVRATAVDILQSLNTLSANGEIKIIAEGRWILSRFSASEHSCATPTTASESGQTTILWGAPGHSERLPPSGNGVERADSEKPDWRLQDCWRQVIAYFAATQKADPRGRITQFADRHGEQWQLYYATGEWWRNAQLTFELQRLAEGFREALMRRGERACAVGYPVATIRTSAGVEFLPAMLLPAKWAVVGDHLLIDFAADQPVLNPDWLRRITSITAWKAEALLDALLPAGEEEGLDAVTRRMRTVLASFGGGRLAVGKLDDRISLGKDGLHNAAAIFLPTDNSYTQGAAKDLQQIGTVSDGEWQTTALSKLFADAEESRELAPKVDVVQVREMTDRQFTAASSILNDPVSLVQGPPGTGKSDIVVAVLVSALLAGKSVLFASRNHQALDEVERRLGEISGDAPVLTRGRDSDGGRDTDFFAELKALAASEPASPALSRRDPLSLDGVLAAGRSKAARLQRAEIELKLAEALDRLLVVTAGDAGRGRAEDAPRPNVFRLLLDRLLRRMARGRTKSIAVAANGKLRPDVSAGELREYIVRLRDEIDRLASQTADLPPEDVPAITGTEFGGELRGNFQQRTTMTAAERRTLNDRVKELEFSGATKAKDLDPRDAVTLLRYRPCWAVSTLSVPSRIPLVPALFDLLVIDEASQCDIASALPLFYRARQAAIVGDPMQLSFIPQLSLRQEHALMDAAGVPKGGRWRIAQSRTSLFDFVSMRPQRSEHFLADQFRSAPGIIDYLNDRFYEGRLTGRRDEDELVRVPDYKPGLAWVDVKGSTSKLNDENINVAEATEVVHRVSALIAGRAFQGTIGILSPFNGQVSLIHRQMAELSRGRKSLPDIKIATIDKFQGGEADVIFFSLVVTHNAGFGAQSFIKKEHRRINVAVSRARSVCVVVGDLAYARSSGIPHLRSLARFATEPYSPPRPPFDSVWERKLHQAMIGRGLEPHPQFSVGRRYLDFALCKNGVQLDVEVDGRAFHTDKDGNRKISDRLRDAEMAGRGWKVRRFWVSELDSDMEKCLDLIVDDLESA